MNYAIIYDSKTGNTEKLARAVATCLPEDGRSVFEPVEDVDEKMLTSVERVYVGFWTDRGDCTSEIAKVLSRLDGKEVFLFGTAGFGVDATYLAGIMARVAQHVPESARIIGEFMCQGQMPQSVRNRYEHMAKEQPEQATRMKQLIDNFDDALGHPNDKDIANLQAAVQNAR